MHTSLHEIIVYFEYYVIFGQVGLYLTGGIFITIDAFRNPQILRQMPKLIRNGLEEIVSGDIFYFIFMLLLLAIYPLIPLAILSSVLWMNILAYNPEYAPVQA